jgi:hypothetical protein
VTLHDTWQHIQRALPSRADMCSAGADTEGDSSTAQPDGVVTNIHIT